MINFRSVKFIKSALTSSDRPNTPLPEVCFLGRSNVGKSSFINSLVGEKIAFPSKKAGKTQLLNYFLIDNKFYLVDTPGYGYTAYGNKRDVAFSEMMEPYFEQAPLKACFLLIDARHGFTKDDEELYTYLIEKNLPLLIVFTKADQANQSQIALRKKMMEGKAIPYLFKGNKTPMEEIRKFVALAFKA